MKAEEQLGKHLLGLLVDALAFVHRKTIKNNERMPRERDGQRTHGRQGMKSLIQGHLLDTLYLLVTALVLGMRQALCGARMTHTDEQMTRVMKT